jgi:hypothetical protein
MVLGNGSLDVDKQPSNKVDVTVLDRRGELALGEDIQDRSPDKAVAKIYLTISQENKRMQGP